MNNYLKVFLVGFTAFVFVVIAALVIIITGGGLITKEGIVETGVIRVEVEPNNTKFSIFLDGEAIKLQDKRINQVREGTYTLRIEAENYAAWEKSVTVTPGLVVDLFVRLYPDTFSLEQITSTNIDQLFYSQNGEFAYYVVTEGDTLSDNGIWQLRLTQNQFIFGNSRNQPEKIVSLTPELSTIFANNNYEIMASKDSSHLLITQPKSTQLVLDLNADKNNLINLETELGFAPDHVDWIDDSNTLLIKSSGLLYEYDLNSGIANIVNYLPNTQFPYTFGENVVYYYNPATEVIMAYKNRTTSALFPENSEELEILGNIQGLHTATNNSKVLIIESDTGFYYYDLERDKLLTITEDKGLVFYKLSINGNSALFLNQENELYSLTIKKIAATSTITKKFIATGIFLEDGDFVKYTPQSTHLVLYKASTKQLSIVESDGGNSVVVSDDTSILTEQDFMVNLSGDSLYLLLQDQTEQSTASTSTNNLYSIDLETAK